MDELLCFLSSSLFQVPVVSFMESNCLIFDTTTEDSEEYRQIHNQYRQIVDALLEAYISDTGLSRDTIIKAMKDLNAKPDLREVFQELFEQVLAMDDFPIFVHLMINKNLELQKQALMLITFMHGHLPSSLHDKGAKMVAVIAPSAQRSGSKQDEDEVLRAVLEQSRIEYEAQQSQSRKEEEDYKSVLNISKVEAKRLEKASQHEYEKLTEAVKSSLRIGDGPSAPLAATGLPSSAHLPALAKDASKSVTAEKKSGAPAPATNQGVKPVTLAAQPLNKQPPLVALHREPGVAKSSNSRDAAAEWLKTAEGEVKSSDAHSQAVYAAAASMAGMSEEEYKKRVDYLKQQRDKLMEMKRREREKQLLSAETKQPTRPASARAARSAMQQPLAPTEPSEEDKKLAMRKAIASRIKSEVMGKK